MINSLEHGLEISSLFWRQSIDHEGTTKREQAHLLFFHEYPGISSSAGTCCSSNTMDVLPHVNGSVVTYNMRDMTDVDPA
jgi:hypothetical protein